jgi:hypothetical protein
MIRSGFAWGGDNDVFTGGFRTVGDAKQGRAFALGWWQWLETLRPFADTCRFIACPDVMHDPTATLARFDEYAGRIAAYGFPVAYVAQDGSEKLPIPDHAAAIFLGGSTEWKMGQGAIEMIERAKATRRWVHVGRVNSRRRYQHFALLGADSCDGTHIVFEPDRASRRIESWVNQPPLLEIA